MIPRWGRDGERRSGIVSERVVVLFRTAEKHDELSDKWSKERSNTDAS